MATTTIRVSLRARDLLQELAQTSGSSRQAVLEQALEQYRRQQLLEATNAADAALRAHPETWTSLQQERVDQTRTDSVEETSMPRRLNRGEIWLADLRPTRGYEPAAAWPVVIISTNTFNHGPTDRVFVLPVTRTDQRIPLHVPIDPPEGGVVARSYIVCDALCTMAKERLGPRVWGRVSAATFHKVEDNLRILMELSEGWS